MNNTTICFLDEKKFAIETREIGLPTLWGVENEVPVETRMGSFVLLSLRTGKANRRMVFVQPNAVVALGNPAKSRANAAFLAAKAYTSDPEVGVLLAEMLAGGPLKLEWFNEGGMDSAGNLRTFRGHASYAEATHATLVA